VSIHRKVKGRKDRWIVSLDPKNGKDAKDGKGAKDPRDGGDVQVLQKAISGESYVSIQRKVEGRKDRWIVS
jgi:hypothetical protein